MEKTRHHEAEGWTSERSEFSSIAREEELDRREDAIDEREQTVDERERELDEQLDTEEQHSQSADARASARAERAQERQLRVTERRRRANARERWATDVYDHLSAESGHPMASAFAQLASRLFVAKSAAGVLDQLVQDAASIVDDADAVSVTVGAARPRTAAASHAFGTEIDDLQYRAGEGPCLDTVAPPGLVSAMSADLTKTDRWPAFASDASNAGCRTVLSLGMFPDTTDETPRLASLNMYSKSANAFDDESRDVAMLLAAHGAVALASASTLEEEQLNSGHLQKAMTSRDVIGQAKGVLMERRKCTPEEAFDILRDASNRLNTKLVDLAESITRTGEVPQPREKA